MDPLAVPERPSLYIQPHYDDVALSCGGTAAAVAHAGFPSAIVTVFAGDVENDKLDAFAARKHERWKLGTAEEVMRTRREEDSKAAAALGCELHWLDHADAIYRDGLYGSESRLYGSVNEVELDFAGHLALQVLKLPGVTARTVFYVPLGIGNHVDHQLVFDAGCALAAKGRTVLAYEDLPYGIHSPHTVPQRLERVALSLESAVRQPIEAALERKLEAIACYSSQLPVIFRFTDDFRQAVAGHARSAGEGTAVERFWRLKKFA